MNAAYKKAWRAKNPDKVREYKRKQNAKRKEHGDPWYQKNAERIAADARKKRYGTCGTDLFEAQGGLCAICKVDLKSLAPKERHLDHNHTTLRVRGWLCHHCNVGIGNFKESLDLLKAASSYLEADIA